ncbi:MAG: YciC family protein [Bdellovibrionota bacterium]
MTDGPAFEIKIGKALQNAWNIFLRAPEVFTVLTLGYFFVYYLCTMLQAPGLFLTVFLSPLASSAFFILAEGDRKTGKAEFAMLENLKPFIPQLVMVGLLTAIIVTLGFICFVIPGIYLSVCYTFAYLMVLQEGKTFWEAMEASRKLVQKNWFSVFGLWICFWLLFFSGFLLAGIGVLLTAPLALLMLYSAYRDIKGVEVIG